MAYGYERILNNHTRLSFTFYSKLKKLKKSCDLQAAGSAVNFPSYQCQIMVLTFRDRQPIF